MHVRFAMIAVFALASSSAFAQQAPAADAQAQAADRQRQQDALPDTPGTGRYAALKEVDAGLAEHVIYRPANLDSLGATKLGVYIFGNGGCTDDGASARLHLLEIASHGYLAIAPGRVYNGPGKTQRPTDRPAPAGPGGPAATVAAQLRESLDRALAENARNGSRYFGRIDPKAVAISGYSCGGVQALVNAKDARIATMVIMNSGLFVTGPTRMAGIEVGKELLADLHTPTLYILGGPTDIAYANGMDDFARLAHVPVAVANIETGHGGTYWEPNGGAAAKVVVDWLDWRLRGDAAAGRAFVGKQCGLCTDSRWKLETKNFDSLH
jgi:dienelactone hydrolase